jgi:hypothetical protein
LKEWFMTTVSSTCFNRRVVSDSPGIEYINTTIELAEPEPGFGRRAIGRGAKGTPAETTDSGKTWKVKEIHMAASNYSKTGRNFQVIGYDSDQSTQQADQVIKASLISQN